MSDPSNDPESSGESPNVVQQREHIKKLEQELKDKDAESSLLRRQIVLRDAGLELTDVQVKALSAVHEGDWTIDGIKGTAQTLGFHQPQQQGPTPEELAAQQRMTQNATGGPATNTPTTAADREARIRSFKGSEAEFDAFLRELGTPIGTIGGPPTSGGIQTV